MKIRLGATRRLIVALLAGGAEFFTLGANAGLVWSTATGGPVDSSPTVVNGAVYIGSDDSYLYSLNAATGKILWQTITGGAVNSSAAVVNGVVYIGSDDGYLYSLNATTGQVLWKYLTGGAVDSSPLW